MLFLLHEAGRALLREVMRQNGERRLTARLTAMTDHQLDDIAVTRGDIAGLAARSYPRALELAPDPRFTLDSLPIAS